MAMIKTIKSLRKSLMPLRTFSSTSHNPLYVMRQLKSYQEALKFLDIQQYPEALQKLEGSLVEMDNTMGKNTEYYLHLCERQAAVQYILGDKTSAEQTFNRIRQDAFKLYPRNIEDAAKRFTWDIKRITFYLDYDVDKACEQGDELLHESEKILPQDNTLHLKNILGCGYALQGERLDTAVQHFQDALGTSLTQMKGYIYNNLGATHMFQYQKHLMQEPPVIGSKCCKQKLENNVHYTNSLKELQNSVNTFEQWDLRYKGLDQASSSEKVEELKKQKLFVDFLFSTSNEETIPADEPTQFEYNMNDTAGNTQFLKELIKKPYSTTLPIQNLGELQYRCQKFQEASILTYSSLLLDEIQGSSGSHYVKSHSLLGCTLSQMGYPQAMQFFIQETLQKLEDGDEMKALGLKNAGQVLLKKDETREEGQRYLVQSEKLQANLPYWFERKMNLFLPSIENVEF